MRKRNLRFFELPVGAEFRFVLTSGKREPVFSELIGEQWCLVEVFKKNSEASCKSVVGENVHYNFRYDDEVVLVGNEEVTE